MPIKYSTGLKTLPAEWNDKKQRIREKRNMELFEDVNANLDRIENHALKTYLAMSNTNELFQAMNFKEQLKIDLGKKKDLTKFSFLEYIEKVIDDCD
ncbi:hypothetical protein [Rhizosphaericola mali]|uniref:Arm DNA-binding domain-containing protein n=1 Tax=Rhizosphaericola mali TaxID=2545455 RepID=A0A5P2G354_9BACT|nr:hypothetical protein [Rhizosphaericola mali]QES89148.1 hypothetical protein E0W69_010910 [Rhizosphaericola mali]